MSSGWRQRAGIILLSVSAWAGPGLGQLARASEGQAVAKAAQAIATGAQETRGAPPPRLASATAERQISQPNLAAGPQPGPAPALDADVVAEREAQAARRLSEKLAAMRQRSSAPRPAVPDITLAARGLATDASFLAPAPRPALPSGPRLAMEPGTGAPAPGLREPEAPAADVGLQPRRLQDTEVTVLLWLAPGSYGIRRGHPSADPILCVADGCYISRGADRPARFLPGRRALGFLNTWGDRAGACRAALGCVFRAVDLGGLPGYLQPVDLHILKHDRRRGQRVGADSSCRLASGRLICRHGVATEDYALWVVPEPLAAAAGPVVLQRALTEGFGDPRAAAELGGPYGR
jgi:hypothetical protein